MMRFNDCRDLGGVAAALARQADMADKLAEALARPGAAGSGPPQDAIVQMYIARLDLAEIIMCVLLLLCHHVRNMLLCSCPSPAAGS